MKIRLVKPIRPDGRDERTSIREDKTYTVLAVECGMFRLVNEFGEPTLHDLGAFDIVDSAEPEFWIHETIDGCRYAGPAGWNCSGFFEDWHNGVRDIRNRFRDDLVRYFPQVVDDLLPGRTRVTGTSD